MAGQGHLPFAPPSCYPGGMARYTYDCRRSNAATCNCRVEHEARIKELEGQLAKSVTFKAGDEVVVPTSPGSLDAAGDAPAEPEEPEDAQDYPTEDGRPIPPDTLPGTDADLDAETAPPADHIDPVNVDLEAAIDAAAAPRADETKQVSTPKKRRGKGSK